LGARRGTAAEKGPSEDRSIEVRRSRAAQGKPFQTHRRRPTYGPASKKEGERAVARMKEESPGPARLSTAPKEERQPEAAPPFGILLRRPTVSYRWMSPIRATLGLETRSRTSDSCPTGEEEEDKERRRDREDRKEDGQTNPRTKPINDRRKRQTHRIGGKDKSWYSMHDPARKGAAGCSTSMVGRIAHITTGFATVAVRIGIRLEMPRRRRG